MDTREKQGGFPSREIFEESLALLAATRLRTRSSSPRGA